MTKFLVLWEYDRSKLPASRKDEHEMLNKSLNAVKERMKRTGGDFGVFMGGLEGYTIGEGTEEEVASMMWQYGPILKYKIYPVLSVDQSIEVLRKVKI